MRTIRVAVTLLFMSITVACGDTDLLGLHHSAVGEGGVETDSTTYHVTTTDAWHAVTIEVSFTNPTREEVRIPSCHGAYPPTVEKLGPGGWVTVYSPVVLLCLEPPVRIAPGATFTMSYTINAGRLPNTFPRLEVDEIAGTYRLNWHALHTKSGSALPESYRTSNPFQLIE